MVAHTSETIPPSHMHWISNHRQTDIHTERETPEHKCSILTFKWHHSRIIVFDSLLMECLWLCSYKRMAYVYLFSFFVVDVSGDAYIYTREGIEHQNRKCWIQTIIKMNCLTLSTKRKNTQTNKQTERGRKSE